MITDMPLSKGFNQAWDIFLNFIVRRACLFLHVFHEMSYVCSLALLLHENYQENNP